MIRFYVFSRYKWDVTQSASVSLFLMQHQPLFLVGFPSYLVLLSLYPVLAQSRVIGRVFPCDLGEAGDRGCVGFDQCRLFFPECPMAIVPKIARFHPLTAFVRVSAFRPDPEHLPLGMSYLPKDVLGRTVPVVICPSSDNGVKCLNPLHCRGLLMCVQVGSGCSDMFEHFFLLWDGQQFSLFPEFPDVKPQEVEPFFYMHYPGLGFTECQSSCLEELSSRGLAEVSNTSRVGAVVPKSSA